MSLPLTKFAVLGNAAAGAAAWRDNDLVASLLILIFGMALGMGLICLLLAFHFLRTGQFGLGQRPLLQGTPRRGWRPQVGLAGAPCRWLAVRTADMHGVQTALRLHNPSPCSWEEGLSVVHEQKLFISPPIDGWVLVWGANLPDPSDDIDRCFHFMVHLSRKVGQVQFYSFNRLVNHHAWAMADQGRIVRAYAWAGRTLWNQGPMTQAERDLGLTCYDYADTVDRSHFATGSRAALNTERVPQLAARWSVDPMAINGRVLRESQGIAGRLLRRGTH